MKFKKSLLIICLIICIFAVASVSATDANDTAMTTTEDSLEIDQPTDDVIGVEEDKELASSGTNEVLKADEQTFSQLNATINGNTDNDIYLTSDYKYSSGDDSFKEGIVIDRDVTIYGNGHTIDGNKEARIFKIDGGNVVFYNITFVNGYVKGFNFDDSGGAINGDCKAIKCRFNGNYAIYDGGAMYGGSATDCTFSGNYARDVGGAIYGGSAMNCTFYGNSAVLGGAIYHGSATDCTFTGNNASAQGGAICEGSATDCTFTANSAALGGAIWDGIAVNCIFSYNSATLSHGGAMVDGSAVNCTFTGNSAALGGAMSTGSAVNCTFNRNYVTVNGGGMFAGSAVNCTFTGNSADSGGAVFSGFVIDGTFSQNVAREGSAMRGCFQLNCNGQNSDYSNCFSLVLQWDANDFISQYGSGETLPINLMCENNPISFINYDVIIYRNGVKVKTYHCLSNDLLSLDLAAGNYTANLTITYPNLDPTSKTIKLTINKATPKIEVIANESTYPNVVVNVKADVSGEYMVKVGDKIQNVNLEANVAKNITFTGLAANEGGYVVNVTHDSENYTGFNDTVKVVVHKATPVINVSAYDVTYPSAVVVSVKSDVNGTYIVKVGDKSQNVTLEANVTKNVIFTGLAANEGGYVVNVTHDSENYTGFNDTVIVKVMKGAVKLTSDAVTATYNVDKNLVITLKDSTGKALSGFKVTVDLNGAKTYTTDSKGQVKVSTKGLAPKAYTAKITFNSNTNYAESTKDVKVTVKKATPKLTAKKKTFKSSVKTKKYTVTLKDNTGKAIKKAKVTLKVKGKTYKATTNSKGKATFKIKKLNKKGTFKATITYKGNKYYNKVSKKAKIKVIITFKTVSKGSKDKSTVKEIQQALKDKGYYLSYKGHYLMVDGKFESCTERSVREFQHDKGLKVTGKVDEKTAKKLGLI